MTLRIPVNSEIAPGIWLAHATPEDLQVFGAALCRSGTRSVLLVSHASVNTDGGELEVPLRECRLANLGASHELVIVETGSDLAGRAIEGQPGDAGEPFPRRAPVRSPNMGAGTPPLSSDEVNPPVPVAGVAGQPGFDLPPVQSRAAFGDEDFLHDLERLPPPLRRVGTLLLEGVRDAHPDGRLIYHPGSGRYVEWPDNFWTIKPQPRAESFAITVRGSFDSSRFSRIEVKPDRGSYSRFTVSAEGQVQEALRIILAARRRW